jgi:heme a synthase
MALNRFQKLALTTVAATLFLILVGSLVRATGAGLGCPDWPKCFGVWIPPTSLADLPAGYDPADFNVVKTWTEYINRLIGVVIGLLIIATAFTSLSYRRKRPVVTYAAWAAFVLVLVQGWLGGMVVRSGLHVWLITLHMMLAMVIMALLLLAAYKAVSEQISLRLDAGLRTSVLRLSIALLVLSLIQMGIGTQLREAIDTVIRTMPDLERGQWLAETGLIDAIHRSFSWSVLIVLGLLARRVWRAPSSPQWLKTQTAVSGGLILLQVVVGIGMAYGGMPAVLQVVHLSGSSILIAAQLVLVLSVGEARTD